MEVLGGNLARVGWVAATGIVARQARAGRTLLRVNGKGVPRRAA